MPKHVPHRTSNEAAEAFLEQEMSDLDWSQFKPTTSEILPKAVRRTRRIPAPLLDGFRARAEALGVPYQRLIRTLMGRGLALSDARSGKPRATG